jgi:Flp pilus assembly protein TadD
LNEALDAANEAIKYAPRNSNPWGIKGDCQFALGQYNDAIESYTAAIELNPEDACNHIGKGESLLSLHLYEDALKCFNDATETEKENAEAWLNKGNAFYEQGMNEKALECLNQALVHNPSEGKALYIKGQVLTSLGEKDDALFCYNEAKKFGFFPRNPPIVDHGRIWQITKIFTKRRSQTPTDIFLHEEMQLLLSKLGSEMGFKVWIAKNDKGKDVNGQHLRDISGFINDFPDDIDPALNKIAEFIDILWLEGNTIRAAFEVESTTSIYSGLLRLSDLISVQSDKRISLYIVAPDERREKVKFEVNRPTFSRLELNKIVNYIPFSKLREEVSRNYKILKYLKPDYVKDKLSESLITS